MSSARTVSQSGALIVRRRSAASSAAVVVAAASGAADAATAIGGPNWTSTRLRNRFGWMNVSPHGTIAIGAPVRAAPPSASRAAPVLRRASCDASCEMPSGKMPIAPPPASTPNMCSNAASLTRPSSAASRAGGGGSRGASGAPSASTRRATGTAPSPRRIARRMRPLNSESLAAKCTGRPHVVMMRIGSISELGWLPANSTGPRAGTCSSPTTSICRKNTRVASRNSHTRSRYPTW